MESNSFCVELYELINQLRTLPQTFIHPLNERIANFRGNNYCPPSSNLAIRTVEGPAGVDQTVLFLRTASPVPPLTYLSPGLCRSCADLCEDCGSRGAVGNVMLDGTSLEQRVQRYGTWGGSLTECTAYGPSSALETLLQWLVDDGNPSRSHRLSLLSPTYLVCGIAHGSHTLYNTMIVLSLASSFAEYVRAPPSQYVDPSSPSPLSYTPHIYAEGSSKPIRFSRASSYFPVQSDGSPNEATTPFSPNYSKSSGVEFASHPSFQHRPSPSVSSSASVSSMVVEKGVINITASGFSAVSQQSDLSLFLQHNRIIFSVSSPSEGTGKAVHSSRSWELPFAPSPRSIAASYNGTSLFLAVSLPSLSPEKTFLVGQFKVSASSTGRARILVAAQQLKGLILLTCIPSKYDTDVTCECVGTEVVFTTRHKENQNGEVVDVISKRVVPLPFVAAPSLIQIVSGTRVKISSPLLHPSPNAPLTPIPILFSESQTTSSSDPSQLIRSRTLESLF